MKQKARRVYSYRSFVKVKNLNLKAIFKDINFTANNKNQIKLKINTRKYNETWGDWILGGKLQWRYFTVLIIPTELRPWCKGNSWMCFCYSRYVVRKHPILLLHAQLRLWRRSADLFQAIWEICMTHARASDQNCALAHTTQRFIHHQWHSKVNYPTNRKTVLRAVSRSDENLDSCPSSEQQRSQPAAAGSWKLF